MGKGEPDISELAETAKIVAEATGRDETDVMADLLDDGIVNMSNENSGKDLVTQLKEAAELITTVQAINKDVAENTVLNGGDNKTEVQIETTLEGDIVDRAIQSIQRKSENLKKLLITLTPLFLLLTGGGLEAIGIIDLYGGESNEINACDSMWGYKDYSWSDNDTIYVSFSFFDEAECDIELEGHFVAYIFHDGEQSNFNATHHNVGYFTNWIDVNFEMNDLDDGVYWIQYEFHDIECENGGCLHGDEWFSPHTPQFTIMTEDEIEESCDAYFINEQAYLLEEDAEHDAVRISADVALVNGAKNCDDEQFEITWRLYQDNMVKYEHNTWEDGIVTDPDGADYTFHTWDAVEPGNYNPKVILRLQGDILDEKWISHSISIEEERVYGCTDSEATNYNSEADENDGSCEYPPRCEIVLFQIFMQYNNNTSWVQYDLDCGTEPNDQNGFNVSVQFWMSENNTSLNHITGFHYIEGYVADIQELCLENLPAGKYDFHWIAIWTDDEGKQRLLEENWLGIELNP